MSAPKKNFIAELVENIRSEMTKNKEMKVGLPIPFRNYVISENTSKMNGVLG